MYVRITKSMVSQLMYIYILVPTNVCTHIHYIYLWSPLALGITSRFYLLHGGVLALFISTNDQFTLIIHYHKNCLVYNAQNPQTKDCLAGYPQLHLRLE